MKLGRTIEEMCGEVLRQSKSKADYIVDTRRLEMECCDSGVILRMLDDSQFDITEPMDVNSIAHRQIGSFHNIPAKYYERMLMEQPELLAQNVNSWFKHQPTQRMLRTLDGTTRAYLSTRYRRIDNLEILQAIMPALGKIPDARFESCEITDSRMYIKVVNPRLETEVTPGDIVQSGVIISNSETGMGSVCIQPLILRLVCMNGMVVNDARTRKNHIGRTNIADENHQLYSDKTLAAEDHAFLLKVQDTVNAATDEAKFHQVVNMMQGATKMRMNTTDIPSIVKLASKDFGLTLDEADGILNQLIVNEDHTLYGLANAVTRYSQEVESYDRATALESIGFDILSMPVHQWNRLNLAQAIVQDSVA